MNSTCNIEMESTMTHMVDTHNLQQLSLNHHYMQECTRDAMILCATTNVWTYIYICIYITFNTTQPGHSGNKSVLRSVANGPPRLDSEEVTYEGQQTRSND